MKLKPVAMPDMNDDGPKLSLEEQIDENLKRVYRDQLEEELPERFTSLLAQLRAGEAKSADPGEEDGNA